MRPLYKKISEFANAEIFAATTLLMVLGTSFLTQVTAWLGVGLDGFGRVWTGLGGFGRVWTGEWVVGCARVCMGAQQGIWIACPSQ